MKMNFETYAEIYDYVKANPNKTQRQLSLECNVSINCISSYRRGASKPKEGVKVRKITKKPTTQVPSPNSFENDFNTIAKKLKVSKTEVLKCYKSAMKKIRANLGTNDLLREMLNDCEQIVVEEKMFN
jgi:hypothetical protein